jgi:hypothetical protein
MKFTKLILGLAFIAAFSLLNSCKEDEAPAAITIVSIEASGDDVISGSPVSIDLNGAASATGVPVNPVVVITFSKDVDATTISTSSVQVLLNGSPLTSTVTTSGAAVTVTPAELDRGTDYTLTISDAVMAVDGGTFTSVSRTFSTGGVAPVTPPHAESQVAYWNFDGNTDDVTGNYATANVVEISFITDRHGQAESTATFDGDASLIEISNGTALTATDDLTISFWLKSNSSDKNDVDETRGQFVFGLAAWNGFQFEIFGNYGGCKLAATYTLDDDATAGQDLWWSTTGNLGWQGWTYDQDVSTTGGLAGVIADKWAHIVVTYDATTKIGAMYINGVLRKSQDFNLYGDTHPLYRAVGMGYAGNAAPGDRLALGFIQGSENRIVADDWANPVGFPDNNHYKGEMDDFRIFHAAYTADDVLTLYNAEKP